MMMLRRLLIIQLLLCTHYLVCAQSLVSNQTLVGSAYHLCSPDSPLSFHVAICDSCTLNQISWLFGDTEESNVDTFSTALPGSYSVIFMYTDTSNSEVTDIQATIDFQIAELVNQSDFTVCSGTPVELNQIAFSDSISLNWLNLESDSVIAVADTIYQSENIDLMGCDTSFTVQLKVLNPGTIESEKFFCFGSPWQLENLASPSFSYAFEIFWQESIDGVGWNNLPLNSEDFSYTDYDESYQYLRRVVQLDTLFCHSNEARIVRLGSAAVHVGVPQDFAICEGSVLEFSPIGCESYTYVNGIGPGSILTDDAEITVVGADSFALQDSLYLCTDTAAFYVSLAELRPGQIGDSQLLCADEPIEPLESIVDADGDGIVSVQWQISLDGLNWTNVLDATQQDYASDVAATVNSSYRRLAQTLVFDTLVCESYSNQVFISVPNEAVQLQGPTVEVCRNSYYVPVFAEIDGCTFDWSVDGGWLIAGGNTDNEVFVHLGTGDSCVVEAQIVHVLSGCEQTASFTILMSDDSAMDTVTVFVIDPNSNLLGISPNALASSISWGYSTPDGFVVGAGISNQSYCYYPVLDTQNFIYWVDLTNESGCSTRSFLNFSNIESHVFSNELQSLSGFPNPFAEFHVVQNPFNTLLTLRAFNFMGDEIQTIEVSAFERAEIGNSWSAGKYVILLMDTHGNAYTYSIVKI